MCGVCVCVCGGGHREGGGAGQRILHHLLPAAPLPCQGLLQGKAARKVLSTGRLLVVQCRGLPPALAVALGPAAQPSSILALLLSPKGVPLPPSKPVTVVNTTAAQAARKDSSSSSSGGRIIPRPGGRVKPQAAAPREPLRPGWTGMHMGRGLLLEALPPRHAPSCPFAHMHTHPALGLVLSLSHR